jgi:HTH-type transcriptional regulator/antitoxin HigA
MKTQLIAIQSPADYEAARRLVASLMDSDNPRDGARLRAQAAIVAAYEAEIAPLRPVDPIEAIKFRMQQMGLTRSDLVGIVGPKSKVSEVLNRKRPLSLAMIRRLREHLDIPADVLIRAA